MQDLLSKLKRDLYLKQAPGVILCNLRESWLEKFVAKYPCNIDALMLGFMLADFRLQEAMQLHKINEHIRMGVDYAHQVFERHEIAKDIQEIVLEIITTHHGGEQKHTESKLFMNADCMGFLEPKGLMHIFGRYYTEQSEEKFEEAVQSALYKAEEKLALVNLDEETIKEANLLFEKIKWMVERMGIKGKTPGIYK